MILTDRDEEPTIGINNDSDCLAKHRSLDNTPHGGYVDNYKVPQDIEKLFPNILRHTFAGELRPPFNRIPSEVTSTWQEHMELWETAVNCISLPTSYDARLSSTRPYGTKDSMSRGCTSRNILHRVFIGQDLIKLLESSSPNDPELDNNPESETDEQDTPPAAGFQPFTTESDDEDTEQVTANAPLSIDEKAKHKAFLARAINCSHTTDHDLQYRTAAQIANAGDAHAMFRCPACQRELDVGLTAFKFYRHIEEPSHRRYFNAHGIQCEFKCGRGFLDETHRFVHYQTGSCPEMKKLSLPLSVKCLRGGPATDRCSFNRNKTFGDHH